MEDKREVEEVYKLPFFLLFCMLSSMDTNIFSLVTDSFWKILKPGLLMTIPLTLLSFSVSEDGESILIYLRGIEDKSLNSGDEYTVLSVRGTVKVLKEDTIWHVFFNEEEIGTFTYR